MQVQNNVLQDIRGTTYGYGAGLMLASLNYHLKFDVSELSCILDDDPAKHDTEYKNIKVSIKCTDKVQVNSDENYLITSLENIRPIYKRIMELKPNRVIVPCLVA